MVDVNDQDHPVMTSEEEALMNDLCRVIQEAWWDWTRQQKEQGSRMTSRESKAMVLNAFTKVSAFILVGTICPSLFVDDVDDKEQLIVDAADRCRGEIVKAVCQHAFPVMREDLKRMGLNCDGPGIARKYRSE
jgi:hypothetical protein